MAVLLEIERQRLILEGVKELGFVLSGFLPRLPVSVDKDDLISESFLAIIRATDKFDPSLSGGALFKSYISPKIRGAIINYLQRFERSKSAFREVDIVEFANNGGAQVFSDNGDATNQIDVKMRLSKMFKCLNMEERILAELYFARDLSERAIAEAVDMEASTVHRQIHRILRKLREVEIGK